MEILKQGQLQPQPFSKQILIIYAGTNGFLDDLKVEEVGAFEKGLYQYADTMGGAVTKGIMEKKILDDQLKADMKKLVTEFKERFVAERQSAVAAKA